MAKLCNKVKINISLTYNYRKIKISNNNYHLELNCPYWQHSIWLRAFELFKFVNSELKKNRCISENLKDKLLKTTANIHFNVAKALCSEILEESIAACTTAQIELEKNFKQIVTLLNYNKIDKTFYRKYEVLQNRLEKKLVNLNLKFSIELSLSRKTFINKTGKQIN